MEYVDEIVEKPWYLKTEEDKRKDREREAARAKQNADATTGAVVVGGLAGGLVGYAIKDKMTKNAAEYNTKMH